MHGMASWRVASGCWTAGALSCATNTSPWWSQRTLGHRCTVAARRMIDSIVVQKAVESVKGRGRQHDRLISFKQYSVVAVTAHGHSLILRLRQHGYAVPKACWSCPCRRLLSKCRRLLTGWGCAGCLSCAAVCSAAAGVQSHSAGGPQQL
jgi:hypothetical protein